MLEKEPVRYHAENGIARVSFNRPEALNAMNKELLQELASVLDKARVDDAIRAVVITGTGEKAFSAGADITFLNQASPLEVRELAQMAVAVNHRIETLGKVVVAAINGFALGGGLELAEACMLRVAVRHAVLGHPEVRIGAIAGFGGTTRLPRLIGKGRAAELRGSQARDDQRRSLASHDPCRAVGHYATGYPRSHDARRYWKDGHTRQRQDRSAVAPHPTGRY